MNNAGCYSPTFGLGSNTFFGNACVSRKLIIDSNQQADRAAIISKYKVGQLVEGTVKAISSFGFFSTVDNQIDTLTHLIECSWQRVNDPNELVTIGTKVRLKIIEINTERNQISTSIRALTPNPWDNIKNYEVGKDYEFTCERLTEYGAFMSIENLQALCHASEISWSRRNPSPKKFFQIGSKYVCRIQEIDKEKKRIAISFKATKEDPFITLEKQKPAGSIVSGEITSINEYALYVKFDEFDILGFCHMNDLLWQGDVEAELKKYKVGQKLSVKVLEINKNQQKCRVSIRHLKDSPWNYFKDKKVNDIITCEVISSDKKGLLVKPEGVELSLPIKKSQIAVSSSDSRPAIYSAGNRVDVAIAELNLEKEKVTLSIKLYEEIQDKIAIDKFGSKYSGKNLPFSQLSDRLSDKKKKK